MTRDARNARYGHDVTPSLWAVTTHFNPCGWQSRRANYRSFRERLAAPLLTVEWSLDGHFELSADDADLLVQVSGGDLMWQKERLLNLGVAHLPEAARSVAWLDGDVVFCDPHWPERAQEALSRHAAVQLFSEAHYLDENQTRALSSSDSEGEIPALDLTREPVAGAARMAAKAGADALMEADVAGQARPPGGSFRLPRNPGLAWAARREHLQAVPFYERAIVGSGDLLFLLAAIGRAKPWLEAVRSYGYAYLAESRYVEWAERLHARTGGDVGYLDTQILHLHHGELGNRSYKERHRRFEALDLDVERDVAAEPGRPLRFARDEPRWRDFMRGYFESRLEDGEVDPS